VTAAIQPSLTEVEAKLLRLALDRAARGGEIETSAIKLIESWRRRGLLAETLLAPSAAQHPPSRSAFSPGDVLMPFGKCRGLPLRRVKTHYLRWVLENCEDLQPELERAIRAVLYGDSRHE
jgi:hypothetical protein